MIPNVVPKSPPIFVPKAPWTKKHSSGDNVCAFPTSNILPTQDQNLPSSASRRPFAAGEGFSVVRASANGDRRYRQESLPGTSWIGPPAGAQRIYTTTASRKVQQHLQNARPAREIHQGSGWGIIAGRIIAAARGDCGGGVRGRGAASAGGAQ